MKLMLGIFFVGLIAMSSYATMVSVGSTTLQTNYGAVTFVYWVTSSSLGSATPATNTAQTPSSSSGSYSITKNQQAYIWSQQFTSAATIGAGTWVLNLWVSVSKNGAPSVSVYVTNSAGAVQSTLVKGASPPSMSANVETYAAMTFALAQTSIPANGYIEITVSPPPGGSATLYWGTGQMSDLQVPVLASSGY